MEKVMKIGIDLDGVVIDSETTFRTYEEIFDIDFLKGNNLVNKEEPKFQARYNWTDKQEEEFIKKYLPKRAISDSASSTLSSFSTHHPKRGFFEPTYSKHSFVKPIPLTAIVTSGSNSSKAFLSLSLLKFL